MVEAARRTPQKTVFAAMPNSYRTDYLLCAPHTLLAPDTLKAIGHTIQLKQQ